MQIFHIKMTQSWAGLYITDLLTYWCWYSEFWENSIQ